jgi:hypothetical protein
MGKRNISCTSVNEVRYRARSDMERRRFNEL